MREGYCELLIRRLTQHHTVSDIACEMAVSSSMGRRMVVDIFVDIFLLLSTLRGGGQK